jgi:hypothetical protein
MHVAAFILAQNLPIRWQSPWLLPAVLAVGAAVALAVLWFYPGQVKNVRAPWRYVIPGLRMLAFMALAVSIARPVALRARDTDDRGVVLVLVDRSRSMSIVDAGRKPGELVALADALGLLPPGVRAAASADVTGDFERLRTAVDGAARAQADLDYARVSGRGIEPAEQRARRAFTDAAEIGRGLAAREASIPPAAGMKGKLEPLGQLPVDDLRGGGIVEIRKRLDAAALAIARYQEQGDQRLYDTNDVVRARCDALAERSRFELAAELLLRPGSLLSQVEPGAQVRVYGFSDTLTSLGVMGSLPPSTTQPGQLMATPAEPLFIGPGLPPAAPAGSPVIWTGDRLSLQPDGSGTEISANVAAALADADNTMLRGVILLSDGQQVGDSPRVPTVPPGVPLISVSVAAATPPKDLAISDVVFPAAAFAGEVVTVRARLRATGGTTCDPASVTLLAPGEDDGEDRVLSPTAVERLSGGRPDSNAWVQFGVRFDRPGIHQITISAPSIAGEASHDNNTLHRWVKVLPDRIRAGVFAGAPGWDYQHLRGTLGRREWFEVESAVLDPANPVFPLTPQQISRLDVLVLCDMPEKALSTAQWYAVEQLVARRGASVVVVAGPSFNPATYGRNPLAAALLPFDFSQDPKPDWKATRGERGARLMPGAEFIRSDVLRLDDADATNRRWLDLSGPARYLPVARPRAGVRVVLREEQSGVAVATEMSREAGRAFYVGTGETWRWRGKGAEAEHERFWRQFIRYAAEEPYAARVGRIALDIDRVSVQAGQPVQIRARIDPFDSGTATSRPMTSPSVDPPPADALLLQVIDLRGPGERVVRTIKPIEQATGGGRLRATLGDLSPGEYLVRVTASGVASGALPEVRLRVEGSGELEMRNLAGDADRLRRMAESTGGRLLRPEQIAAIPAMLATAADDRPRFAEWRLWDSPWLFGFVVACLGAEWALRKRTGLA